MSDRIGRRPVLIAWGAGLALLSYPLMSLMARGTTGSIIAGEVGLALLVAAGSGALPATMAELAPWRVRCTVVSVSHNLGMALLGGTTPLMGGVAALADGRAARARGLPGRGGGGELRGGAPAAPDGAAPDDEGVPGGAAALSDWPSVPGAGGRDSSLRAPK